MDPRPLAVVDIDGVVADVRHRLHYIEGKPRQWDRFFSAATDCWKIASRRSASAATIRCASDSSGLSARSTALLASLTRESCGFVLKDARLHHAGLSGVSL